MPRQKLIAGNWKMYTTAASARELARAVAAGISGCAAQVAVAPPFPWLASVAEAATGTRLLVGAQDVYPAKEGAFTGEVSPPMLLDAGCAFVIVGHSERRHVIGESDELINRKTLASLEAGLTVILCIGETLPEREANRTNDVLAQQLAAGLKGVSPEAAGKLVIAYEPVWAIGTGKVATTQQAQDAHAFTRAEVSRHLGQAVADAIQIQYGGSVKPDNAAELLAQPDVDGALVGGASLKADSFLAIVRAAG